MKVVGRKEGRDNVRKWEEDVGGQEQLRINKNESGRTGGREGGKTRGKKEMYEDRLPGAKTPVSAWFR